MFYLWFYGDKRPWRGELEGYENAKDMVMRVLKMGMEVVPGHEALWAFVRGCVVGMEGVLDLNKREGVVRVVERYVREMEEEEGLGVAEKRNLAALKRLVHMVNTAKVESSDREVLTV